MNEFKINIQNDTLLLVKNNNDLDELLILFHI